MGNGRSGPRAKALHPAAAVAAAVVGTLAMAGSQRLATSLPGFRTSLVVAELLLVVPGLLALGLGGVPLRAGLGLSRIDGRTARLCLAAGVTLWIASAGLIQLQAWIWPPDPAYLELFRRLHRALRPTGPLDAVLSVLAIAVAPAVFEELLVRGIVLPAFVPPLGPGGAVVGSALVFGLMHLDPYRFAFTFTVGLVLGFMRVRTRVLPPSVLAHAVLNALTFGLAPFLDDPAETAADPVLGAVLLLVGVAATLAVLRRLRPALTPPRPAA
jgi:membrane protease YdiL (CAAX protease family)